MGNWTASTLRNRVLEYVGAKAAGQPASAEDASLVDDAVESAHDRLRGIGLAPFELTAIPPWAQTSLKEYVGGDVGREFGLGDSLRPAQAKAEHDLRVQCAIHNPAIRTKIQPF